MCNLKFQALRNGIFASLMAVVPASAEGQTEWKRAFGFTLPRLAQENWALQSSAGLSWPDGSQAIITFWRAPFETGTIMKCVTRYDTNLNETQETCYEATEASD